MPGSESVSGTPGLGWVGVGRRARLSRLVLVVLRPRTVAGVRGPAWSDSSGRRWRAGSTSSTAAAATGALFWDSWTRHGAAGRAARNRSELVVPLCAVPMRPPPLQPSSTTTRLQLQAEIVLLACGVPPCGTERGGMGWDSMPTSHRLGVVATTPFPRRPTATVDRQVAAAPPSTPRRRRDPLRCTRGELARRRRPAEPRRPPRHATPAATAPRSYQHSLPRSPRAAHLLPFSFPLRPSLIKSRPSSVASLITHLPLHSPHSRAPRHTQLLSLPPFRAPKNLASRVHPPGPATRRAGPPNRTVRRRRSPPARPLPPLQRQI